MGGVPRLASSLASAIKSALGEDELAIATTGLGTPRPIPNKLVALLTFTGLSSFDRLFRDQHADALFLPNLEFVGRPRVPYALLVHDLSFLIEPRWFDRKSRIWHTLVKPKTLIKNAAHLFAVSETTKRDLVRLLDIPANRITVIPMGLDPLPAFPDNDRLSRAHDHAHLRDGSRFILCLGGANRRKNASCVTTAHAELIKDQKYKDVKLVMIGAPNAPRPSDAELFALMRDAAIFCYPSWYEGFGMPLHEAARFGTPCIASTSSSLPETAPEGTTFASPAKPHQWVEAMCQVLDNPEKHRTKTVLGGWDEAGRIIAEKLREISKG
jgi:glycosyltransferase involved in cell wall biosynthesis